MPRGVAEQSPPLRFALHGMLLRKLAVDWAPPPTELVGKPYDPPSVRIGLSLTPAAGKVFEVELAFALGLDAAHATGYRIEAVQTALCVIEGEGSTGEVERLAAVNGATVLYGALRGQLSSLLGAFPGGTLTLPAIYMAQVWEAQLRTPKPKPPLARRKSGSKAG